ncbi:hypothetical protein FRC16_003731 [Serendipita sp. 398]|nr:hypothetical protein FRC16_003731 [Serendipita sp. 398]
MDPVPVPTSSASIPLASQVGGHAGVRSSADGSQIMKPCLPAERHFYETVISADAPAFRLLAKHVPGFFGIAPPEEQGGKDEYFPFDSIYRSITIVVVVPPPFVYGIQPFHRWRWEIESSRVAVKPILVATKVAYLIPNFIIIILSCPALVLENLSHAFTKPNILDIKLGTVLYDDAASEEKKQRMIKSARETTSFETGVRITGFQVYDTKTERMINVPKDYGRALKVSQLPEAIARFFPIKTPILSLSTPTPDSESTITPSSSPAGTEPRSLLPVLRGVLDAIREIREALAQTELRMVGGSVLVIYEGDSNVLARALDSQEEAVVVDALEQSKTSEQGGATITSIGVGGVTAGAGAGVGAGIGGKKPIPAYAVKLIDFAHTKLEEGIGPDEGVVLGLDTTISLLEGRIKEAEEALGSVESVA